MALRASRRAHSEAILDHAGAEELRGSGDAIVSASGAEEARVQFPLVTGEDLAREFSRLKERHGAAYARGDYFSENEKERMADPLTGACCKRVAGGGDRFSLEWEDVPFEELALANAEAAEELGAAPGLRIDHKNTVCSEQLARAVRLARPLASWDADSWPDEHPGMRWDERRLAPPRV